MVFRVLVHSPGTRAGEGALQLFFRESPPRVRAPAIKSETMEDSSGSERGALCMQPSGTSALGLVGRELKPLPFHQGGGCLFPRGF